MTLFRHCRWMVEPSKIVFSTKNIVLRNEIHAVKVAKSGQDPVFEVQNT